MAVINTLVSRERHLIRTLVNKGNHGMDLQEAHEEEEGPFQ
jgi:hypothetical protein